MEIVNGNSMNATHANVKRSRSTFPLKQIVMDTHRFGEYHPHFVFDGVTSDKLPIRSAHNARSYTLKAPLMQDIQMHKDYFMIPLRAILPFQADRIITNPTFGDDVPHDAYTNVESFTSKVSSLIQSFVSKIDSLNVGPSSSTADKVASVTLYLKMLILSESVFSHGCLLSSLGCNLSSLLEWYLYSDANALTTDQVLDGFISDFSDAIDNFTGKYFTVRIDGTAYRLVSSSENLPWEDTDDLYITIREFLEKIRDTSDWFFTTSHFNSSFYIRPHDTSGTSIYWPSAITKSRDIDIARLWAYHLCCAAFYTDDKIDYIYSADLFRQYIRSLIDIFNLQNNSDVSIESFSWNGFYLQYDFLSSHYFNFLYSNVSLFLAGDSVSDVVFLQYFLTLFGYHRSLRYKDYFTGSRTRPLAVGNTNIPVVGGNVSVIDVSRNIQVQRFLNAVNATGRKYEEYLKGIFGVAPSPDHHNPLFLAHSSDTIYASEVENTGAAQQTNENSVTAVFRGNGNQFVYEVSVDEPCIILGITSYDIERSYINGIERSFNTKDRFDMFLPQLQYVGDQPVYKSELRATLSGTFGYQFRDMDRKQLINRACGGFSSNRLPGYAFVFGKDNSSSFGATPLSPDFIRSKNVELDEFYLSLTGWSLGTYFHFIVINYNSIKASRPMAVNPQILG